MFASLAIPNYRKWFIGGLTSNVGTWMMRTSVGWLVLVELTAGDMGALGVVVGLQFLPALLLSVLAGSLADRVPKRRIMLATQTLQLLNSATLGVLVVSGTIELWHVFAFTVVDGIATAVDAPARQAFVSEVVGREHLGNAISLNSTSFNGARLLGPGLAGVLIALLGSTGPVFLINATTYLVLLAMLLALDVAALHPAPSSGGGRGRIAEGLRYVAARPDLKLLLAVGFVMGNFGFNFAITNPIMANNVFGVGPGEFGALGSLMGIGALAGALTAAARRRPRLRYVITAMAGFSVISLASAWSPNFVVFALLMVPIGFCTVTTMVTANTLVQTSLAPGIRGRVMALWMLVVMGGTPVIGPVIGWIGGVAGPRWTVMVGVIGVGAMALAAAVWILHSEHLQLRLRWEGRRPRWVVLRPTEEVDPPVAR